MLKDLNWRPLDQRGIDSRLMMRYKATYNLVAIPASLYLVRNTRASRHIHYLAYRQIQTLKDYYRFLQNYHPLECPSCQQLPTLPTLAQFSSAVCWVIHVPPPKYQPLVLSFIYTNCTNSSHHLFYHFVSTNPLSTWYFGMMSPTGVKT